ncbi:hypothetical protein DSL72_005997 [Monilinia vaccinii-corymbosi]|uniref:Cyanovirin-N domain-containing protein n=1 Tax=Monilinia vaccinii-corymbosi TaxID=61207 RepID=A0A8A3PH87_9HELO|nr:hypothetical protein DSL72_005997 [Monilinia vaccinii-corymbosi]
MTKLSSVLLVSVLVSVTNAASGFLGACNVGTLKYNDDTHSIYIKCGNRQLSKNLADNCIANSDGALAWDPNGNYDRSCDSCRLKTQDKKQFLECESCSRIKGGSSRRPSIDLNQGIGYNGGLYCNN